jgi:hypothetical protein
MSADVASPADADDIGERLWNDLVERHASTVWQLAARAGLDLDEAATVSQLVWLRMAERWTIVRPLAAATERDGAGPSAREQLDDWLQDTVSTEVKAWIDDAARRARDGLLAAPTVIRLAPGFSA